MPRVPMSWKRKPSHDMAAQHMEFIQQITDRQIDAVDKSVSYTTTRFTNWPVPIPPCPIMTKPWCSSPRR